jgi:tetratricopeptide (TPR) repeat protein
MMSIVRFVAVGLLVAGNAALGAAADDVQAEWNRLNEAARITNHQATPETVAAARRALDFAVANQKALGPGVLGTSWHNFGQVSYAAGNLPEARAAYEKALPLVEQAYGAQSPHLSIALNSMAIVEIGAQHYGAAEEYARRALGIARALDPTAPQVAEFSNTLAWALFNMQQFAEAAELYAAAIKLLEPISDPKSPELTMLRRQLEIAKAGIPSANTTASVKMAVKADTHDAFIAKIATLARQRDAAGLLDCFDEQTRKQQEADIRQVLEQKVYKFFADSTGVAPYDQVTNAAAADGRTGLWHYGFVETKKHKLQPFQLAIIDGSAGPRLLYIDTGSCVAGRHPKVGPCE